MGTRLSDADEEDAVLDAERDEVGRVGDGRETVGGESVSLDFSTCDDRSDTHLSRSSRV